MKINYMMMMSFIWAEKLKLEDGSDNFLSFFLLDFFFLLQGA